MVDAKTNYKKVKWEYEEDNKRNDTPTKFETKVEDKKRSDLEKLRMSLQNKTLMAEVKAALSAAKK